MSSKHQVYVVIKLVNQNTKVCVKLKFNNKSLDTKNNSKQRRFDSLYYVQRGNT